MLVKADFQRNYWCNSTSSSNIAFNKQGRILKRFFLFKHCIQEVFNFWVEGFKLLLP